MPSATSERDARQTLMAITVTWETEDLLHMRYQGLWSNDEFRKAGMQAILMVRSVTYPIYVLTDYIESELVPLGVLWQARDLSRMRPPNWEAGVMVTQDTFIRSLMEVYIHIYMLTRHQPNQFIATSIPEALELIARLKQEKENRVS